MKMRVRTTAMTSIILVFLVIFAIVIFTVQLIFRDSFPKEIGIIGDAINGITSPVIGIAVALLTFLAFYMQKEANEEIRQQFKETAKSQQTDFVYGNLKGRIELILNEINIFEISFHDNKMISNLEGFNSKIGKKYNFVGIQALSLFLIEYYRDKREKKVNGTKQFIDKDSYHGTFLTLQNIVSAYYNIFSNVVTSDLKDEHLLDLKELLQLIYYTKIHYLIVVIRKNHGKQDKFRTQIDAIHDYYDQINKELSKQH